MFCIHSNGLSGFRFDLFQQFLIPGFFFLSCCGITQQFFFLSLQASYCRFVIPFFLLFFPIFVSQPELSEFKLITWVGGRTRGEGRGVHHKVPVSCAIEVRHRKPGTKLDNRKDGRYAGRVRLAVVLDRSAESLCGFVESTVAPGSLIVTDDWSGYAGLGKRGYEHFAVAECGDSEVAEQYLPIIHLVFANLKTWLIGIHHGVSHQHLQAYLNEFTFRFNRRFYPFNAFRSLLGIAGDTSAPTYAELYSGEWRHPTCSGHGRLTG